MGTNCYKMGFRVYKLLKNSYEQYNGPINCAFRWPIMRKLVKTPYKTLKEWLRLTYEEDYDRMLNEKSGVAIFIGYDWLFVILVFDM